MFLHKRLGLPRPLRTVFELKIDLPTPNLTPDAATLTLHALNWRSRPETSKLSFEQNLYEYLYEYLYEHLYEHLRLRAPRSRRAQQWDRHDFRHDADAYRNRGERGSSRIRAALGAREGVRKGVCGKVSVYINIKIPKSQNYKTYRISKNYKI